MNDVTDFLSKGGEEKLTQSVRNHIKRRQNHHIRVVVVQESLGEAYPGLRILS